MNSRGIEDSCDFPIGETIDMSALEQAAVSIFESDLFARYRECTIGTDQTFISPYGEKRIIYADWTASGRLYRPLEQKISDVFGPFVANTHSESSTTGTAMTLAYRRAREIIKSHVNAGEADVLITYGTGMTGAVNKFQRILGLKAPENLQSLLRLQESDRPVIFVTHMEHHSNQTSWLETIADVELVPPDENGAVDLEALDALLVKHGARKYKIGSFTACSNVTGVITPYHQLAKRMHRAGGICFVDFSASAPYVKIDMHPGDEEESLDAIFFSPHKFLGGPGSAGVLIFNQRLQKNRVPDTVGGGVIAWSTPWRTHEFVSDSEAREDAGTPGFLQTIRAALAIRLKETMGIEAIARHEKSLVTYVMHSLQQIKGLTLLAAPLRNRLPIFSFYIENVHYNLVVRLLNDRYGIQVRGGCSCAGTYGHFLLNVDRTQSKLITDAIDRGDSSGKPGWIRLSFHPTTSPADVDTCMQALREIAENASTWEKDYDYDSVSNEYVFRNKKTESWPPASWFDFNIASI